MVSQNQKSSLTLGIHKIEPVDIGNPLVASSLEQARRVISDPRLRDILQVRTTIQQFLCDVLAADGYIHPPVYVLAGCTDPLNHWTYPARINYYGEEVSVTQSLILYKILMVMLSPIPRCFGLLRTSAWKCASAARSTNTPANSCR